jgi:hypothetical protein
VRPRSGIMDRMPTVEYSARLFVDYGQYFVRDVAADAPMFWTGATGLIGSRGDAATVATGTHTGYVSLTVLLVDVAPPLDLGPWDDVVEVGMTSPHEELEIYDWSYPSESVGGMAGSGSKSYRLRVHARGRDAARDGTGEDGAEQHLIVAWPDKDQSTVIHKATDQVGAYLRYTEKNDKPKGKRRITTKPKDMSVFATPPWEYRPHDEVGWSARLDRAIVSRPHLQIALTEVEVYSTGIMFSILTRAQRDGEDDGAWARYGQLVQQGFVHLDNPGNPPTTHEDGLQLTVAYPGQAAVSTRRTRHASPDLLPPQAPSFIGWFKSGYGLENGTTHQGWLWPLPPPGEICLTLQWTAIGVEPVTIDLDGAAVVERRLSTDGYGAPPTS